MKNYLLLKNIIKLVKRNILLLLISIVFFFVIPKTSYSTDNVFTVNNVEVKGVVNLNFSREKYLDKAFLKSFKILMTRILLSRDLEKVNNLKLKQIKNLISRFQILDEKYTKNEYKVNIKIFYNNDKVKKFLGRKNISYSEPENISAVFYPVLFINGEIQNFNENFFYKNWNKVEIKNEMINFILPLEDLEDFSKIIQMRDNIEELDIDTFIYKYDVKNYVFALIEFQNEELYIHLKTNFRNKKINKNISHNIANLNDEKKLYYILKDLKLKITDIWREENLINLLMPLSIRLNFQHKNIKNMHKLINTFKKIGIVDNYTLEEFNIDNSFFKIYYYGNPKKLKSELSKFGYQLKNEQGYWQLYLNE